MSDNGTDPVARSHRAANSVFLRGKEAVELTKKHLATRPAVPLSDKPDEVMAEKPLPKSARLMDWARLRGDEASLKARLDEARGRQKLPPDKPVSREEFERWVTAEKELRREMGNG